MTSTVDTVFKQPTSVLRNTLFSGRFISAEQGTRGDLNYATLSLCFNDSLNLY